MVGSTGPLDADVPYCSVFLLCSILVWALELYIDLRQRRRLAEKMLPDELKKDFTQEEFTSACDYSIDKISFEMLSNTISTFAQALFFLMGGLAWLWSISLSMLEAMGLGAEDEVWHSMLFCLLYLVKSVIESAPYDLYSTFVVEERHGFNKQTPRLWLMDQLKTNLLIVVLGFPCIALGIKIIKWAGPSFWLYVWLFCLVLLLVFMYIFPNVISPMFNKFSPLHEGELKAAIENLAKENKFPLKQLFVVDGSTRSSHSNAYFYGFGTNKRVVLYDTLNPLLLRLPKEPAAADTGSTKPDESPDEPVDPKKICTVAEIVAILGHELGHWSMSHLPKQLLVAETHLLFFFFTYGHSMQSAQMFASFGFPTSRPIIIGLLLFSSVISPLEQLVNLAQQWLTRKFEYEADRFAVDQGRGADLAAALVKISTANKSNLNPDPLWSAWNNTHPSLIERLRAIEAHKTLRSKQE